MGTDAELYSRKKHLSCYIDRKDNVDLDGCCEYDALEAGVLPHVAISMFTDILINLENPERHGHKPSEHWLCAAILFARSLDADDTIVLRDEHEADYHNAPFVDEPKSTLTCASIYKTNPYDQQ